MRQPGQLAGGDRLLLNAIEVGQGGVDFRQRADRQDHVGDGAGRLAGELAERHHLRAAQGPQRELLVGEVQARLDAVDHIGLARLTQHRLRIARGRQHAEAG